MKKIDLTDIGLYIFLILSCIVMIFPFVYVIAVSFADARTFISGQFILYPKEWSLDAYRFILSTKTFLNSFKATLFITVVGTILSLLFTTSFAYAVTKQEMPGRKLLIMMVLFTFVINAGIIPNYLLVMELGLLDSLWALILPVITNAWSIIVVKSFFHTLPESLEDAAQIDGCNELMIWYKIILPLSLPVIAAFSLFFAVSYWNIYFAGLIYIQDPNKYPLQLLLRILVLDGQTNMGDMSTVSFDPNSVALPPETIKMAATVIVMLPILLVYPFLQKYFAKGVLLGSVKG